MLVLVLLLYLEAGECAAAAALLRGWGTSRAIIRTRAAAAATAARRLDVLLNDQTLSGPMYRDLKLERGGLINRLLIGASVRQQQSKYCTRRTDRSDRARSRS